MIVRLESPLKSAFQKACDRYAPVCPILYRDNGYKFRNFHQPKNSAFLYLMRQTAINKITQTIWQNRKQPNAKTHWPWKRYQPDVFLKAFINNVGGLVRFHKKWHRTGIFIGYSGAYKARANHVYGNVLGSQTVTQSFAIGFDARFAGTI